MRLPDEKYDGSKREHEPHGHRNDVCDAPGPRAGERGAPAHPGPFGSQRTEGLELRASLPRKKRPLEKEKFSAMQFKRCGLFAF